MDSMRPCHQAWWSTLVIACKVVSTMRIVCKRIVLKVVTPSSKMCEMSDYWHIGGNKRLGRGKISLIAKQLIILSEIRS
jgi:hypothetical protein